MGKATRFVAFPASPTIQDPFLKGIPLLTPLKSSFQETDLATGLSDSVPHDSNNGTASPTPCSHRPVRRRKDRLTPNRVSELPKRTAA